MGDHLLLNELLSIVSSVDQVAGATVRASLGASDDKLLRWLDQGSTGEASDTNQTEYSHIIERSWLQASAHAELLEDDAGASVVSATRRLAEGIPRATAAFRPIIDRSVQLKRELDALQVPLGTFIGSVDDIV